MKEDDLVAVSVVAIAKRIIESKCAHKQSSQCMKSKCLYTELH